MSFQNSKTYNLTCSNTYLFCTVNILLVDALKQQARKLSFWGISHLSNEVQCTCSGIVWHLFSKENNEQKVICFEITYLTADIMSNST